MLSVNWVAIRCSHIVFTWAAAVYGILRKRTKEAIYTVTPNDGEAVWWNTGRAFVIDSH